MTTKTKTPLGELPGMNDIKIGPGGETFGQLKQRVLDCRAALMRDSTQETVDALNGAIKMLKAAYTRVGLPYKAP